MFSLPIGAGALPAIRKFDDRPAQRGMIAFQHRNVEEGAFAGALAPEQRRHDGEGPGQTADRVGRPDSRRAAGLSPSPVMLITPDRPWMIWS